MTTLSYIGNILPEDYKVIGWSYLSPYGMDEGGKMDFELEFEVLEPIDEALKNIIIEQTGNKGARCNHCNAHISYIYIVKNIHTNTIHTFGSTCGLDIQNLTGFSIADAQEKNMKERKKFKREGVRNEILRNNPGLKEALEVDHKIISKIAENFKDYDKISAKQIELVFKIQEQTKVWAEAKKGFADVPEGKIAKQILVVTGVKTEMVNGFGYNASDIEKYALTLQHKDGWKIWGRVNTVNFTVVPQIGNELEISAIVSKSQKDSKFGFFKNARITK